MADGHGPARTVWAPDRRCPACGGMLLTNGYLDWCSRFGGGGGPAGGACEYGITAVRHAPGKGRGGAGEDKGNITGE